MNCNSAPKRGVLLTEAVTANDPAQYAEVSRRFFFTKAGGEAALLLARHHLDHGSPLAAAFLLERLRDSQDKSGHLEPTLSLTLATAWLRAGMPEKALVVLAAFKRDAPAGEIHVGGKPVKLFADDAHALAWLEEKVGGSRQVAGQGTFRKIG